MAGCGKKCPANPLLVCDSRSCGAGWHYMAEANSRVSEYAWNDFNLTKYYKYENNTWKPYLGPAVVAAAVAASSQGCGQTCPANSNLTCDGHVSGLAGWHFQRYPAGSKVANQFKWDDNNRLDYFEWDLTGRWGWEQKTPFAGCGQKCPGNPALICDYHAGKQAGLHFMQGFGGGLLTNGASLLYYWQDGSSLYSQWNTGSGTWGPPQTAPAVAAPTAPAVAAPPPASKPAPAMSKAAAATIDYSDWADDYDLLDDG